MTPEEKWSYINTTTSRSSWNTLLLLWSTRGALALGHGPFLNAMAVSGPLLLSCAPLGSTWAQASSSVVKSWYDFSRMLHSRSCTEILLGILMRHVVIPYRSPGAIWHITHWSSWVIRLIWMNTFALWWYEQYRWVHSKRRNFRQWFCSMDYISFEWLNRYNQVL